MARTAEEIYQDALKLTPDEREILEVLLRMSLPLPDDSRENSGMTLSSKDQQHS
ncbi:MAG: hypothetical protein QGH93_08080 [Gammaproteobacteria bacterium]|jgi:hypothetical protein|nr:hypothetical protein [Gammaproteobacteria bacterium]